MPPQTEVSSIKYRPDVDGLRAVAVLLVLASHLETQVTGGFVGVDVFFVISGYLISATILKEMGQGTFSIVNFYERRVRRIFPAMLAMLAVVSVVAYHYLLPLEMMSYCRSLLAALASGSNFWFWHDGGYFNLAELKPLLHTWSLGVEEQFYILFPLLLVLIRRWFPTRLKAAILGLTLVSFAAACWAVRANTLAAFFFTPLRAWELLFGTIVSQRYVPALRTALSRNAASGLGLLLILVPAWQYGPDTRFPGLAALPACLGAALIIAAGDTGSSLVGRVLAWRPVVFIGLISYSVYLWHWPMIVFQTADGMLMQTALLSRSVKIVLGMLSLGLGAASWKFIEQPFRKGPLRPSRRGVFAINGLSTLALAVAAATAVFGHGFPGRFPSEAQKVAAYVDNYRYAPDTRKGICFIDPGYTLKDFREDACLPDTGRRSILIAGDSHTEDLWPGLRAVYPDMDLREASASNCPPLIEPVSRSDDNCKALFQFLYGDYLKRKRVDVMLLSARWRPTDMDALGATIAYAHAQGIPVALLGPGIEYDQIEPHLIALSLRAGHPEQIPQHVLESKRQLDVQMAELARTQWHVPYLSIFDALCRPVCPVYAGPAVPFLFDNNHMTEEGSVLLMRTLRESGQLR